MRSSWLLAAAGLATMAASPACAADKPVLAICADPTNLPYSNEKQEGFENRIANVLAADFQADLRYTWNQERRSFFRRTLFAGACDIVISVPAMLPAALPKLTVTKPSTDPKYPDQIFVFPMAMGVRSTDIVLRDRLQSAIDRHAAEIATILTNFGVPAIPLPVPAAMSVTHAVAAPLTR